MHVTNWLRRLFRRPPEYVYGTAGLFNRLARKHRSGRVEFVLWKAGQQGHKEDYWHPFHPSLWSTFVQEGTP